MRLVGFKTHFVEICGCRDYGTAKNKIHPAGIYLFEVNRNTRKRCEICSKLTIKTPERRHRRRSGVFIVTFEHDLHLFLVFLLLILSNSTPAKHVLVLIKLNDTRINTFE